MKTLFLSLSTILISVYAYSQSNNDNISYKAIGIYMIFQTDDGKEVTKIPLGKYPEVVYDKFFKSYSISFEDVEKELQVFSLTYVKTEANGYIKMRDHQGNISFVSDSLASNGELLIIGEEKRGEYISIIKVEGAKRE